MAELKQVSLCSFGLPKKFGGLMRESTSPGLQPYKYGGKELDRYAGLDAYDFGARSYFADRMQWSTMDPLSEKYYDVSPYGYCLDNPVKYIDPDGKEKLIFFNKEDDNSMYMGAQRAYNDNAIHVFAHGNESSILPFNNITGIVETIDNPEAFIKFLEQNSDTWKTTKDKSKLTIVLHSCKTGRGEKSFAALLSRELKDITIIAPDNNDYINDRGESGVYVSERDNNKMNKKTNVNDAKKGKQTENKRTSIKGSWNIFKNGTIVDSYDGTWVPKEKPSWTDRFLHH